MSHHALPSLADVIEKIGMGPAQLRFVLTGGGVWFADGAELLLISAVTMSVAKEWGLNETERGSMVTTVYLGVCVGNLVSGPLGDIRGRKEMLQSSYIGIFVFSILSSLMFNFTSLCALRFLVGFAFGFGQSPVTALAVEVVGPQWRVVVNVLFQTMFPCGEMYSASLILMDDPTMKHLNWRRLLQLGALPALVFWIAANLFLRDSPFWFAKVGRHAEAREVLSIMQADNGLDAFSVEYDETAVQGPEDEEIVKAEGEDITSGTASQYSKLRGGSMLTTTVICSFSCFTANMIYYGSLYAYAQVLPHLQHLEDHSSNKSTRSSAGMELLIGALWEFPGYGLVILLCTWIPRKLSLKMACLFSLCATLLFVVGATSGHGALAEFTWHIGYYLQKCMVSCLFVMVYVYIGEVYPTELRATGSAVCIAFGRVGATISPLVFEYTTSTTGSFACFFYVLAVMTLCNLLMIDFLPYETFNAPLTSRLDDLEKLHGYGGYGATEQPEEQS